LICFGFISLSTKAQFRFEEENGKRFEAGFNFGPSFFLGDLGGNQGIGTKFIKDINPEVTKMQKGIYCTYYPNDVIGLRLSYQSTFVAGDDNLIKTNGRYETKRKERRLDFRSKIQEFNAVIEFYPTMLFRNRNDFEYQIPKFQPYGFIGLGIFHFDPEGSLPNPDGSKSWYKLHELRTEGQGMAEYPDRKPYQLTQMNVPMGFGLRVNVNEAISTSLECNYRATFTDYIDDVSTKYIDPINFDKYLSPEKADIAWQIHDKSMMFGTSNPNRYSPGSQRGNPKNTDSYFSFLFKLGINLNAITGLERSADRRALRASRCPAGVY
jgi:hypothetical protein